MADKPKIPLTPSIAHGDLLFLSGQLGYEAPGKLAAGGIEAQTRQTFSNIERVLSANGATIADIIKATVFLTDKANFAAFNAAYASYFPDGQFPTRSTVVCELVAEGALVEIEVVARTR